jgi:hypothetical protein
MPNIARNPKGATIAGLAQGVLEDDSGTIEIEVVT